MTTAEALGTDSNGDTPRQYLTFILADEEYGIDILRVREIRGWSKTRSIPNAPSWLKGMINLRGNIVPIIDLRERFNIEPLEYGPTTVVIIIRSHGEANANQRDLGIVVDAVSEVYSVAPQRLKSAPDVCGAVEEQFIQDIAMIKDKMIILLDTEQLRQGTLIPAVDGSRTNSQKPLS